MSRLPDPSEIRSASPVLVWALCVLALGLLGWRCVAIFSSAPEPVADHPLAEIVSVVVGAGNAQISETASGDLLILLNGPSGAIDPSVEARLTEITKTIGGTPNAPILKQFPFAEQAFAPTQAELAEVSVLGLLASLAFFLAFAMRGGQSAVPEVSDYVRHDLDAAPPFDSPPPPPFDSAPVLTKIDGQPSQPDPRTLADAQSFARANPDVTAKVIERWIRARGFHE